MKIVKEITIELLFTDFNKFQEVDYEKEIKRIAPIRF